MVWGSIAYNTRSLLILIHGTMTAQLYVHDILQPHMIPLMQRFLGAIFQQVFLTQAVTRLTVFSRLLPFLGLTRFVSNRAYLESFGTESWASLEFE
ncbi:hypothetical protein TNCV_4259891 [Trichonephila clavipes]|nr:hypothetical protein TNCV_4259891 [Trichonephila clavipes]